MKTEKELLQSIAKEMVKRGIEKETYHIDWDSQVGMEIQYQIYRFADRGYFDGKSQDEVDIFLRGLVLIATAGVETAKTKMNDALRGIKI